jgi:hypothetical protein
MQVGTTEHRDLFCASFIAGHRPYKAADLPWPTLEPVYLARLRAIPFWAVARAMERRAGLMVSAFAELQPDPVIREAIRVQGVEEARHAEIMDELIRRYEIPVTDVPVMEPVVTKDDFVTFGYEECLDYFMGGGLFKVATDIDFFPADFVAIFDEVLFEEARHVTFFINWFRYEEARAGRDGFFERHITALRGYAKAIRQLVATFSGVQTTGFAAMGAKEMIADLTPIQFIEGTLAKSRELLGRLDRRLVKPGVLPTLATIVLVALRSIPPRAATQPSRRDEVADRRNAA